MASGTSRPAGRCLLTWWSKRSKVPSPFGSGFSRNRGAQQRPRQRGLGAAGFWPRKGGPAPPRPDWTDQLVIAALRGRRQQWTGAGRSRILRRERVLGSGRSSRCRVGKRSQPEGVLQQERGAGGPGSTGPAGGGEGAASSALS